MSPRLLARMIVFTLLLAALPVPASAHDPALPDLTPVRLVSSPASPQYGQTVFLNATIHNAGAAFHGLAWVAFVVDGQTVATREVRSMAAGANATISTSWTAQPGDHRVEVVADWNGTLAESDETNNLLGHDFSVLRPDLVVTNASMRFYDTRYPWAGPGYEGDRVTFWATIVNMGPGTSPSFRLVVRHDGEVFAERVGGLLKPGQEAFLEVDLPRGVAGTHVITVELDPQGKIPETDETNNLRTHVYEILPIPVADVRVRILEVTQPTLQVDPSPPMTNPLGSRRVRVEVANIGPGELVRGTLSVTMEGATAGNVTYRYSAPLLVPGESTVIQVTYAPKGVGDLRFRAQFAPLHPDPDPGNNADTAHDFVLVGGTGVGVVA